MYDKYSSSAKSYNTVELILFLVACQISCAAIIFMLFGPVSLKILEALQFGMMYIHVLSVNQLFQLAGGGSTGLC